MPVSIKRGNLCDSTEQYILQQCNCLTIRAHGLSAALAARFPDSNPYSSRRKVGRRNLATPEDRPEPGTIQVLGQRRVIAAFAQVAPGKPGQYSSEGLPDTAKDRLRYFQECLNAVVALRPESVAIPWKIGCGLAGGNWEEYGLLLSGLALSHPEIHFVFYFLDD